MGTTAAETPRGSEQHTGSKLLLKEAKIHVKKKRSEVPDNKEKEAEEKKRESKMNGITGQ